MAYSVKSDPAFVAPGGVKRRVLVAYSWIELGHRVGIARYARKGGWILEQVSPGFAFRLKQQPVDGIICQLSNRTSPDLVRAVRRMATPTVELSNRVEDMRVPRVMPDFKEAGRTAARHFLSNRFRHFAYVSVSQATVSPISIYAGFAEVLSAHKAEPAVVVCNRQRYGRRPGARPGREPFHDRWHGRLRNALSKMPTPLAVVANEFDTAVDVFDVCRAMGLLVPEQVALVTWSQEPEESELTELPFSGFSMDYERQGYEAAAALDRLMDGKPVPDLTLIPPRPLIVRASSDMVAMPSLPVARALRYIQAHLAEPSLCTKRLVSAMGISRTHLYRLFREHFSRSVSAQIKHVRIESAMRMLSGTRLRVHEIARRCGYSSGLHFSRSLFRLTGQTPRDYRKRHAKTGSPARKIES
jgi:LacI family transcriptional regulator